MVCLGPFLCYDFFRSWTAELFCSQLLLLEAIHTCPRSLTTSPPSNQRLGCFPTITSSEAQKRVCKNCLSLGGYCILLEKIAQSSRPCNLDYSSFPISHWIFKSIEIARDTKNQNSALGSRYLTCSCLGTERVDTWVCIATGPTLTGITTSEMSDCSYQWGINRNKAVRI